MKLAAYILLGLSVYDLVATPYYMAKKQTGFGFGALYGSMLMASLVTLVTGRVIGWW